MSDGDDTTAQPSYPDGYRLQTSRLQLRAIADGDAKELWPLMSDRRITTFLAWEPHQSIEETGEMIRALVAAQQEGRGYHWVVVHAGKVVGLVSLIDVRRKHRCWTMNRSELAYWIGIPYQRMGFATEAAAAVIGFGFTRLHLRKILVYHAADNPSSGRTIEKLGFRFVGEERDSFQKDSVWHNLRHFEMLADEMPQTDIYLTRSVG
jgi:ribosomal-protein-alanine N-acetyltransferase